MKKNNDKTIISIGEAAELAGVHIDTLRNWEKRGLVQSVKTLGGHRRYHKEDILNLAKKGKSMEIFTPTIIRKFRFLLGGEHLQASWIHSVDINWTKKRLLIRAYEAINEDGIINIHEWASNVEKGNYPQETLILTNLDENGIVLFNRRFSGLTIKERKNSFNYGASEPALHIVTVNYLECELSKN